MKLKTHLILAVIALATSIGCSRAPEVSFGLVEGEEIIEIKRFEYELGEVYGYRLDFGSDLGKVKIREEFVLPGPAPWDIEEPIQQLGPREIDVSEAGSRLIEEIEFDAVAGTSLIQEYVIIDGDPRGQHVIRLWLNGEPLEEIEFIIE